MDLLKKRVGVVKRLQFRKEEIRKLKVTDFFNKLKLRNRRGEINSTNREIFQ